MAMLNKLLVKFCSRCGIEQDISEYRWAEGRYQSWCRSCYRENDRLRRNNPVRKSQLINASRKLIKQGYFRSYQSQPTVIGKDKVRRYTRRAIKNGELKRRPCTICGARAQAHHNDYIEPLNVSWLCPLHHKEVHSKANPTSEVEG